MKTKHTFYIVRAKPFLMRKDCQIGYLFRSIEDTRIFTDTEEAELLAWEFLENEGNWLAKAFTWITFIVTWSRYQYTIDDENLEVLQRKYKEAGFSTLIRSYPK